MNNVIFGSPVFLDTSLLTSRFPSPLFELISLKLTMNE